MDKMKRIIVLVLGCIAALTMFAQVTIDARDLKLYEETAGFPIYILRMEANSSPDSLSESCRVGSGSSRRFSV